MGASDTVVQSFHEICNGMSLFHEFHIFFKNGFRCDFYISLFSNDFQTFSIDATGSARQHRRISTKSLETVLNFNEWH